MLSEAFRVYVSQNIALARSIKIKCELNNTQINEYHSALGVPVSEDPTTWKYYQNLAGEYHATDTLIRVISSDTREEIDFTLANMPAHPVTSLDYGLGGRFYKDLVEKHPSKEILIQGITAPVDKATAIAAADWTILGWDRKLVASNEENLIYELQKWVNNFAFRWFKADFRITDPLYGAAFINLLYMHMPQALINVRIDNSNTPYVDDFHLWTELAGHYDLDNFKAYLHRGQALWLYRNITNVRRRAGLDQTLDELVDNVTTPQNVKINKVDFLHSDNGLETRLAGDPSFSVTDYYAERDSYSIDNNWNNARVLDETRRVARDNNREYRTDLYTLDEGTQLVLDNRQPTPLFQAVAGFSAVSEGDIWQLRMDYWFYLSSIGLFNSTFSFLLPDGNSLTLSAKDAALLFIYATHRACDIPVKNVQNLTVYTVYPIVKATQASILERMNRRWITAEEVLEQIEAIPDLVNIEGQDGLVAWADDAASLRYRQRLAWQGQRHYAGNGYMRDCINALHTNHTCQWYPSTTSYDTFFDSISFNKFIYTDREYGTIAETILAEVTGIQESEVGLSPSKRAMLSILDRLTSYSTIFTEAGSSSVTRYLDWTFLHPGTSYISSELHAKAHLGLDLLDVRIGGDRVRRIDGLGLDIVNKYLPMPEASLDLGLELTNQSKLKRHRYIRDTGAFVSNVEFNPIP